VSWPKLIMTGTVTVTADGHVNVADFEFDHCTCRQAAQLGMAWAMQQISAALIEDMTADEPNLSSLD
jgi:hypothetical protein